MIKIIIIFLIRSYQKVAHFLLPKACRFHPSCSQYAIESVSKYGIFRGLLKATVRILRCSPLSKGGYDPA